MNISIIVRVEAKGQPAEEHTILNSGDHPYPIEMMWPGGTNDVRRRLVSYFRKLIKFYNAEDSK